jgi:putative phosphoesterase
MARILLLADIHANWPALQAVKETYDLCIFLGDLVDYGLEAAPCIDWVRKNAKIMVRGNHDHGAAQNVTVIGMSGFKYLTGVTRPLTRQLLSETDRRFLMEMPVTRTVTIDDVRYFLVHATPRDPLDEYAPADKEFWERRLEGIEADVICVGHTHIPFVLEVGNKIVVNPGSIGLPRDGNPRASYAILEGKKVELKRVEYSVEQTVSVIQASALPDPAKELLAEVYRTGEAKNQKVDTKLIRARPSNQGMPKPGGKDSQIIRPKLTSTGTESIRETPSGLETDSQTAVAGDGKQDTRPLPLPIKPPETKK